MYVEYFDTIVPMLVNILICLRMLIILLINKCQLYIYTLYTHSISKFLHDCCS